MLVKVMQSTPEAKHLWLRRVDALKAGSVLLAEKPDRALWSDRDVRIWRYAAAISRRMERLN